MEGYIREDKDALDAFLAHTWAVTVIHFFLLFKSHLICGVLYIHRIEKKSDPVTLDFTVI